MWCWGQTGAEKQLSPLQRSPTGATLLHTLRSPWGRFPRIPQRCVGLDSIMLKILQPRVTFFSHFLNSIFDSNFHGAWGPQACLVRCVRDQLSKFGSPRHSDPRCTRFQLSLLAGMFLHWLSIGDCILVSNFEGVSATGCQQPYFTMLVGVLLTSIELFLQHSNVSFCLLPTPTTSDNDWCNRSDDGNWFFGTLFFSPARVGGNATCLNDVYQSLVNFFRSSHWTNVFPIASPNTVHRSSWPHCQFSDCSSSSSQDHELVNPD